MKIGDWEESSPPENSLAYEFIWIRILSKQSNNIMFEILPNQMLILSVKFPANYPYPVTFISFEYRIYLSRRRLSKMKTCWKAEIMTCRRRSGVYLGVERRVLSGLFEMLSVKPSVGFFAMAYCSCSCFCSACCRVLLLYCRRVFLFRFLFCSACWVTCEGGRVDCWVLDWVTD